MQEKEIKERERVEVKETHNRTQHAFHVWQQEVAQCHCQWLTPKVEVHENFKHLFWDYSSCSFIIIPEWECA